MSRAEDDLALARACLAREPAALSRLEAEHIEPTRRRLARQGFSAQVIDEACQVARLRLLFPSEHGGQPALAGFTAAGPIGRFVEMVIAHAAAGLTQPEKTRTIDEEHDDLATQLGGADIERALGNDQERQLVRQAVHEAIGALTPRERALLRFHLLDHRTHEEIALIYGVARVTATRWVGDVRQKLTLKVRNHLNGLGLDQLQLSQIDLSLSRILGDA